MRTVPTDDELYARSGGRRTVFGLWFWQLSPLRRRSGRNVHCVPRRSQLHVQRDATYPLHARGLLAPVAGINRNPSLPTWRLSRWLPYGHVCPSISSLEPRVLGLCKQVAVPQRKSLRGLPQHRRSWGGVARIAYGPGIALRWSPPRVLERAVAQSAAAPPPPAAAPSGQSAGGARVDGEAQDRSRLLPVRCRAGRSDSNPRLHVGANGRAGRPTECCDHERN